MPALHSNDQLAKMALDELFVLVRHDWRKPYFGAVPYIAALSRCRSLDTVFIAEPARDLVPYFLANAGTWRGPVARAVKAELKRRLAC